MVEALIVVGGALMVGGSVVGGASVDGQYGYRGGDLGNRDEKKYYPVDDGQEKGHWRIYVLRPDHGPPGSTNPTCPKKPSLTRPNQCNGWVRVVIFGSQ